MKTTRMNLIGYIAVFFHCIPLSLTAVSEMDSFKIINKVNSNPLASWRAGLTRFHADRRAFVVTLGTKWLTDQELLEMPKQIFPPAFVRAVAIPAHFDAREKWPNCTGIQEIRDQGGCGSCWAHAVAETLSDRICITSKTKSLKVNISVQDLMTCCPKCGGCKGGIVEYAFEHFVSVGIVTGGDFLKRKGCRSYSIAPETWFQPVNSTPVCSKTCYPGYRKSYSQDLYQGSSWHVVAKLSSTMSEKSSARDRTLIADAVRNIQLEILLNGPVTCSMKIYDDFRHYESGIYSHLIGSLLAAHAMKILGWGVDETSKLPFWLIANSWGREWGEEGFARVRRGVNECGVESRINAGIPKKY